MYKKVIASIASIMLAFGAAASIAGPASAATPDHQLEMKVWGECNEETPTWCYDYEVMVKAKKFFHKSDSSWMDLVFIDTDLYNASGKKVAGNSYGIPNEQVYSEYFPKYTGKAYEASLTSFNKKPLPKGNYTLRMKVRSDSAEYCEHWTNWWTGEREDNCLGTPKASTHYLTYSFYWNGSSTKANRQSFTKTVKKTETTATTYTAKKSASYTANAQYTSKQTAKVKHKGKTYKATASATTKKTYKVTKKATVKAVKLKKKATATAKVTSYHSAADAQKKAAATASKDAKNKATKAAKNATDKKASSKAKSMITKKVKDDAKKKAKAKITKKVKTDTQKKAYKAALKAAKKKAGIK